MKILFDFSRAVRLLSESPVGFFTYVPQRGKQYFESLKWVRPAEKCMYERERSGDLVPLPKINPDSPYWLFKNSKELETADEKVKKIFSVGYQIPLHAYKMYQNELLEKVRNNPYDENSLEVRIAKLTATIRYSQKIIENNPPKYGFRRSLIRLLINRRGKYLKLLRSVDYKKFEWLLETLDLEYKPTPEPNMPVTRKRSLTLLAKLKVENMKEKKLAALKKSYDEQKIPFLENKIIKLKEIKAKEEKYKLPVTVTDADIEECIQKLERVKVEVAERAKIGYARKIHPYFLEPYHENLLLQAEKKGEKIRELMFKQQKNAPESTS